MLMRCSAFIVAVTMATAVSLAVQDIPPRFVSGSTEIVVLPVAVTDKQGAFVPSLERERFAVFDNGRRQEIAFFNNDDVPVSVGLVLDSSGSMVRKLPEVIVATLAFSRLSNPQDELFTVSFNDVVRQPRGGPGVPISDTATLESELRSLVAEGRTALYDALAVGLDRVSLGVKPRKALVVISDGGDNASRTTLEQVLADARSSNVVIFTIGLFDDRDPDRNPGVLKSLAETTGGERFLPKTPSQLLLTCERIARDLRSAYTIGYVPPDHDGGYHRVRVDVNPMAGRKLVVRTRPGYVAARQETVHQ
jgi:Ca-activated chloride channel family protein